MLLIGLTACAKPSIVAEYPEKPDSQGVLSGGSIIDNFRTIKGGFRFGGGGGDVSRALNVNSDLWQATLDSLDFLPLASANPEGGVIITDWYEDTASNKGANNKGRTRFKVNVVITGRDLRSDSLRVSVFRQRRTDNEWRALGGSDALARQLENIILSRARDFKLRRTTQ